MLLFEKVEATAEGYFSVSNYFCTYFIEYHVVKMSV